jgi:hypothetical protein
LGSANWILIAAGICLLCWMLVLLRAAAFAALNLLIDPFDLYHGHGLSRSHPNIRRKKLEMFAEMHTAPGTLILGASRLYNLDLSARAEFPAPVFNFSVTVARAEDLLALYKIAAAPFGAPKTLVIGIAPNMFHPRLGIDLEAVATGRFRKILEDARAVKPDPFWRQKLLFSREQATASWNALVRTVKRRSSGGGKFRWHPDGHLDWTASPEPAKRANRIARQLFDYPRKGLAVNTFTEICPKRKKAMEELLDSARNDGALILVYIAPDHPELLARLMSLGAGKIYAELACWLRASVEARGGVFLDLSGDASGLWENDFRDAIHLTNGGQKVIAELLASAIKDRR